MILNKKLVGAEIKKARMIKGLTQEQLAEIIDITPMYMKHLEAGRRSPSIETLYNLCIATNLSVDTIFFPQNNTTAELRNQIERKLNSCSVHELNIINSTIEAMLKGN